MVWFLLYGVCIFVYFVVSFWFLKRYDSGQEVGGFWGFCADT